ncbi:hypothetical protein [Alkalihalobacterium sp. APHAB7]|uniref:hypothetical protein n=1 Tax=Alkalihalobacterium sp. APHAB7 TaxID=3402081 RepID=UPI003AAD1D80
MKKMNLAILLIIALLFLFSMQSLAVEFTIPNVEIKAHLQSNGNVEVKETFTYAFDSEYYLFHKKTLTLRIFQR